MEEFRKRICKLIDVKSLLTLSCGAVFCAMALCQWISSDQFIDIFKGMMYFYFGTQVVKKAAD